MISFGPCGCRSETIGSFAPVICSEERLQLLGPVFDGRRGVVGHHDPVGRLTVFGQHQFRRPAWEASGQSTPATILDIATRTMAETLQWFG